MCCLHAAMCLHLFPKLSQKAREARIFSKQHRKPPCFAPSLFDIRSGGVCVQANELNIHTYFTPWLASCTAGGFIFVTVMSASKSEANANFAVSQLSEMHGITSSKRVQAGPHSDMQTHGMCRSLQFIFAVLASSQTEPSPGTKMLFFILEKSWKWTHRPCGFPKNSKKQTNKQQYR